jgi:hypothetical protein
MREEVRLVKAEGAMVIGSDELVAILADLRIVAVLVEEM